MRIAAWAAALALTAAPLSAGAQDQLIPAQPLDIVQAINGVWAFDTRELPDAGELTCDARALALAVSDDARVLGALTQGSEQEPRTALILNVDNDTPLGPTMLIEWTDETDTRADGSPEQFLFFMQDTNSLFFVSATEFERFANSDSNTLARSPRLSRCLTS